MNDLIAVMSGLQAGRTILGDPLLCGGFPRTDKGSFPVMTVGSKLLCFGILTSLIWRRFEATQAFASRRPSLTPDLRHRPHVSSTRSFRQREYEAAVLDSPGVSKLWPATLFFRGRGRFVEGMNKFTAAARIGAGAADDHPTYGPLVGRSACWRPGSGCHRTSEPEATGIPHPHSCEGELLFGRECSNLV